MEKVKTSRLNSEKRIEHENFKLKLGTTNKNNPLIVYVEGKAFISPNEEKETYTRDINDIKRNLQWTIKKTIENSKYFQNDYILDFQVANSGIRKNKKSFLSVEFLFKQHAQNILKLKDVKKYAENDIKNIITSLSENITKHDFSLYKTKK